MTKEGFIANDTFKDAETLGKRVFYCLTDGLPAELGDETTSHLRQIINKQAKAFGLLMDALKSKGTFSDEEIDEMMFDLFH